MPTLSAAPATAIGPASARLSRRILGVRVDATSYASATRTILNWAGQRRGRYVVLATVNNIMEARVSASYRDIMEQADLATSDGMPLVWMLRALGIATASRVYGPDLMLEVLAAAAAERIPVGFYGGSADVLARLVADVATRFPALRVTFAQSPPFRPPTPAEDRATLDAISTSGARIVFVGLGSPKQDLWMQAHRDSVEAVMLGVGAAFDFLAGAKPQAPRWMMRCGLEWAFRLAHEPRRLWRRYLKHNPRFIGLALAQILRARLGPPTV